MRQRFAMKIKNACFIDIKVCFVPNPEQNTRDYFVQRYHRSRSTSVVIKPEESIKPMTVGRSPTHSNPIGQLSAYLHVIPHSIPGPQRDLKSRSWQRTRLWAPVEFLVAGLFANIVPYWYWRETRIFRLPSSILTTQWVGARPIYYFKCRVIGSL